METTSDILCRDGLRTMSGERNICRTALSLIVPCDKISAVSGSEVLALPSGHPRSHCDCVTLPCAFISFLFVGSIIVSINHSPHITSLHTVWIWCVNL